MLPALILAALPLAPLNQQASPTEAPKEPNLIAQAPAGASSQAPSSPDNDSFSVRAPGTGHYPYASFQIGPAFPQDLEGRFNDFDVNTTLKLNAGFNAEAAIGYRFDNIRTDLSVGYGNFAVNQQSYSTPEMGSVNLDGDGSLNVWTVMANVYYDIPLWSDDDGNQFKLSILPDSATPGNDFLDSIEIWDPSADQNRGAWVPYSSGSFVTIPSLKRNTATEQPRDLLLVRIPIRNDSIPDEGESFSLLATNRLGMTASGSATISELASAPIFSSDPFDPTINLTRADKDKRSIRINNISVNEQSPYAIFSIQRDPLRSRWSPYIGAGIGYASVSTPACAASSCYNGGTADSFAWQAKLGLSYRATDRGFAFLEGGYLGTTANTAIDDVSFGSFGDWRINIGWRQGFGRAPRSTNKPIQSPQINIPAP